MKLATARIIAELLAASLALYLRLTGRTMVASLRTRRTRGSEGRESEGGGAHAAQRILGVFWSADQVLLCALAYAKCTGASPRAYLEQFCFVADDTLGGEIMARFLARLRLRCFRLARSSAEQRLLDLKRLTREESGPVAIAVDGGGPYFQVSRAVVALADGMDARLVPLGVRATRTWRVGSRIRLRFPRPGSELELIVGGALDPRGEKSARRLAGTLAGELATLART